MTTQHTKDTSDGANTSVVGPVAAAAAQAPSTATSEARQETALTTDSNDAGPGHGTATEATSNDSTAQSEKTTAIVSEPSAASLVAPDSAAAERSESLHQSESAARDDVNNTESRSSSALPQANAATQRPSVPTETTAAAVGVGTHKASDSSVPSDMTQADTRASKLPPTAVRDKADATSTTAAPSKQVIVDQLLQAASLSSSTTLFSPVVQDAPQTPSMSSAATPPSPQQQQHNMTRDCVHHMLSLLQLYGPLTAGQLEYNLPPFAQVQNVLQILVAVGVVQVVQEEGTTHDSDTKTTEDTSSSPHNMPEPPTETATDPVRLANLAAPPNQTPRRYCIAQGRTRVEPVLPHELQQEIRQAQTEVVRSWQRTHMLRQVLLGKAPSKSHVGQDTEDQEPGTQQTGPTSTLTTPSVKQSLQQLLQEYPEIAFDPVYVTALRLFHVDTGPGMSTLGGTTGGSVGSGGSDTKRKKRKKPSSDGPPSTAHVTGPASAGTKPKVSQAEPQAPTPQPAPPQPLREERASQAKEETLGTAAATPISTNKETTASNASNTALNASPKSIIAPKAVPTALSINTSNIPPPPPPSTAGGVLSPATLAMMQILTASLQQQAAAVAASNAAAAAAAAAVVAANRQNPAPTGFHANAGAGSQALTPSSSNTITAPKTAPVQVVTAVSERPSSSTTPPPQDHPLPLPPKQPRSTSGSAGAAKTIVAQTKSTVTTAVEQDETSKESK